MRKRRFYFICFLAVLIFTDINYTQGASKGSLGQDKMSEGKQLFINANLALSEKRFVDAYGIAERLIRDYAGDYHIGLYLRLYANTFYFLDKDFQKGMLRPTPPGIQKRINELKTKENKTVIDLVKLTWIGNGPGGDFSIEYLEEILDKFSSSVWAEWAEWMLIQEREYRPREKYQDKSPEKRSKLLMRDLYVAGKKFINENPDSYMLPRLLQATARWGHRADELQDAKAMEEAVQMCYRVLRSYPTADYDCAEARRILRDLLGNSYEEILGCSEEVDRIITQFYCISPDPAEHENCTKEYIQMIEKGQAETKKGSPLLSYVLITTAVAIVIVGIMLLLMKKASIFSK